MSVLLQTSFGDITIDLFWKKAPNTALNFIKLCKTKFYNNALFAEVEKNHLVKVRTEFPSTIWKQSGLQTPYFKDEIDVQSKINSIGMVATANNGTNLNNSDFFITLTNTNLQTLAGKHTVFGKVQEGIQVLRKINDTYTDNGLRPQMNIRIMHAFILDDPFPDIEKMRIPQRSPSPARNSNRLEAIQHLEMLEKCKNENEIIEATKIQKMKKQAMTLQILGDMPDANLKPPENILFVCKLNPITQEKDLEIIFSRFGLIKSVEVVRDWKTGQSLQYGFIEFDNINSCQEAYIKMNNVVIDDRRIQVDFSQSVSKLLKKNYRAGMTVQRGKYGEPSQRRRELLPKSFTQGKDNRQKYELITAAILPRKEQPPNKVNVQEQQQKNKKRRSSSGEQGHKSKRHKYERSRSKERKRNKQSRGNSGQRPRKHKKYVSESPSK